MQDPREPSSDEISNPKQRKKKMSSQKAGNEIKGIPNVLGALPLEMGQKASERNLKNEVSPLFQQSDKSNSDSLLDLTTSENDYRALRRKYLLLEEESFVLDKELRDVEDESKTLEDEKHTLLDQLVVLEGLIDTSDIQSQQQSWHPPPKQWIKASVEAAICKRVEKKVGIGVVFRNRNEVFEFGQAFAYLRGLTKSKQATSPFK